MAKERLDEDGQLERYCPKCGEWWPADREFFFGYTDKSGKEVLGSYCKACYLEWRKQKHPGKGTNRGRPILSHNEP